MKVFKFFSIGGMIMLIGSGCVSTSPTQNPQALSDANFFKQSSSGSIPLGIGEGYKPADPAPATTTNPSPETGDQTVVTPDNETNQPAQNTVVNQPKTPAVEDYNDALAMYRNRGAYIQFSSCRGNPGSISIKKNVKFMIDNRDSVGRTFVIAKSQYNIAKYGFAVVTSPNLPGTYYITCNGGGSAALNVQN